uniref:Uncharacterized protein n=1 Tax=Anopheles epiroticus TaxID=199890 RepID=A0A182PKM0_9DIPT
MSSQQVLPANRVSFGGGRLIALLLFTASCLVGSGRYRTLVVAVPSETLLIPPAFRPPAGLASLNCKICHSTGNYEECLRSSSAPCTVSLVNATHLFLATANPSLRNVTYAGAVPQFQCFQVNYTVGVMWHYQMGCTYATTKICEGWRAASKCATTTSNVMGVPGRVRVPHIADYNPNAPPLMIHPLSGHAVQQGHVPIGAPAVPVPRSTQSAAGRGAAVLLECLLLSAMVGWAARTLLGGQ